MKDFPLMRQVSEEAFVPAPAVDDPFGGEFERLDDLNGHMLYTKTRWRVLRHVDGTPIAATNGETLVPWTSIRFLRRDA